MPKKNSENKINNNFFRTEKFEDYDTLRLVEYCGNEEVVIIPDEIDDMPITVIGKDSKDGGGHVFFHNKMKKLVLPKHVFLIEPGVIFKCPNLQTIEVDKENTNFKSIDGVLFDQKGEDLVLFPSGRTGFYGIPNNVTDIIAGAFYNCAIKDVYCGYNVETIEEAAFWQSENLEEIDLGHADDINSTAFVACRKLKTIKLKNSFTYEVQDGVLYNDDFTNLCFYPPGLICDEFIVPETVKSIGPYAFAYCREMKIVLPENLRTIGESAFMNCCDVELVAFGNVYEVAENCFAYTYGMELQTRNRLIIDQAEHEDIIIKEVEEKYKMKKLTRLEHSTYMPDIAKMKLNEPLEDEMINPTRASNQKLRNESIQNFPWGETAKETFEIDLNHVQTLMDKELYKLCDAKRQVLRSLAVSMKNPRAPLRPILLVGPAGTGKTSFAKVISEAMGKPLKRISMPSLSAAWQFTGTEKAYGTAGCGIIIQAIIDSGEFPVFLFDEVDKADGVGGQFASVQHGLLNLLDDTRESFRDEFFEAPVDLRNAFFILTANDKYKVNKFVMDRCRVIYIEGYKNDDDRRLILKDYMIPRIYRDYNLTADEYTVSDETLELILAESKDEDGGLRVLQVQAEAVLQEAILRMKMKETGSLECDVMTPESVKSVLAELSKKEHGRRIYGFHNKT